MAKSKQNRRHEARAARQREASRQQRARVLRRAGRALGGAVVVTAILLALFMRGSGGPAFAGDFRVGGTVKKLDLPALSSGGTLSYDQFREKPLVLNFFASWCEYCVGEMPGFESVHEQAGSRVAFLGVSQSDAKSASLGLVHKTAVTYPTAIDAHGAFFSAVGTGGMPTTLFILPGGKIAYIQIGPLDERTLKQDIQSYLRVSV